MKRQKLLHKIFESIINRAHFWIDYKTVSSGAGGLKTLTGICDFHHVQPGDIVTIATKKYTVQSFDETAGTMIVKGVDVITAPGRFELNKPFFCHGTPMEVQAENSKIVSVVAKTPMIYVMEPYVTLKDHDPESSIEKHCTVTVCFLTEAKIAEWLIDDTYKKAIKPMCNLLEDFELLIEESQLFSTVDQTSRPKYHTKFGIRIIEEGTKQLLFSETFAGVSVEMVLDIYREDSCACPSGLYLQDDENLFIEVD